VTDKAQDSSKYKSQPAVELAKLYEDFRPVTLTSLLGEIEEGSNISSL